MCGDRAREGFGLKGAVYGSCRELWAGLGLRGRVEVALGVDSAARRLQVRQAADQRV